MKSRIQFLTPDINDKGVDHRGAIYSFVPQHSIVEFVYLYTVAGTTRGHHYHKEFDEYIMLVDGEGLYLEKLEDGSIHKHVIGPGQTIYIPSFTNHTFVPLKDCKSVSFLTKKWNDCDEPITPTQ
jgi:dTDP-4-dehydrorhamnose 3,5-epimerase-like enzyme